MKTAMITKTVLTVVVVLGLSVSAWAEWSAPVPVSEVNTEYFDCTPFLSFDGLSLYFARGRASGYYYYRIFEATRQQPFGPFTSVNEVLSSSVQHVFAPWVSPDNLRMYYFAQKESPALWQLKVSERASVNDPWPQGSDISELNQLGKVYKPGLTADELTIVFTSYDIAGGQGGYDIWMATRTDRNSPFENVTNLSGINTASNDGDPFISPDGLTLYFNSDRNGAYQLFRAARDSLTEPFGNVEHLSCFDTPGGSSVSPSLSSDGTALYFVRSIGGQSGDIYVSYSSPGPGPIAHWKLDEGSGVIAYDSAGDNDGTLINGPVWVDGQIGGALDFDGVDDYVDMADMVKNYLDTNYTVSAWIKTNTITGIHSIAVYRRSTLDIDYQILFHLDHIDSDVRFIVGSLGNNAIASYPDALTTDTWYNIVGIREGNLLNVYVNGVSGIPDSETLGTISPDNLKIGAIHCCDHAITSFFDGTIDDVRIYNRALSDGEIEQLYAYGGENLLVNGSFETQEVISGGCPSTCGDWSGDHSYILPRYGDLWPFQGSRLMQFVGTSEFGCGGGAESQVYQIVDMSAFAGDIAANKATATASAYFNRVAGDAEADMEFAVDIQAFEGDPCQFPTLLEQGGMYLARANVNLYTDANPSTWERCEVELVLPPNTDYVVVGLHAIEDICNDPCWPEFDGHFADAAFLTITVEPNVPEPEGIYYVDGVYGSDDSNGLNPESAFATIQMGIDTAEDGDTIFVYPAVYDEALLINNKAIRLLGVATSAGIPIVQKEGDYALSYYVTGGPDSLLRNFVIRESDLGIFIVGGAPRIRNITIVDNVFGIAAYAAAQPDISNCILWNNKDGDLFGDPDPIEARYSLVREEVNEPILTNLVSHWKFDEAAGSIAYDSAGTNHGTIYGAAWTTGPINSALSFDGVDDYVDIPYNPSLDINASQGITLSVWFKLNSYPDTLHQGPIFGLFESTGEGSKNYLLIGKTFHGNLITWDHNPPSSGWIDSIKPDLDTWYHVTVVEDSTYITIYINGSLDVSDNISESYQGNKPDTIRIGNRVNGLISDYFEGTIDDVRIYDRALSAGEIEQLYEPTVLGSPIFGDDYHLRSQRGRHWPEHDVWVLDKVTSSCVDGGDPAINPSNEPMPNGGRINMGAYGNTAYASMSEWPIEEDNNRDGIVNMLDIANVAARWLEKLDWVE